MTSQQPCYGTDDPPWARHSPQRRSTRAGWALTAPEIYGHITLTPTQFRGGNCTNTDPEMFFNNRSHEKVAAAKRVCRNCPLRQPCLAEAMRPNPDGSYVTGIWGATTYHERQLIRHHTEDVPRAAAS
jgi:hypothetical protein